MPNVNRVLAQMKTFTEVLFCMCSLDSLSHLIYHVHNIENKTCLLAGCTKWRVERYVLVIFGIMHICTRFICKGPEWVQLARLALSFMHTLIFQESIVL